MNIHPVINGVAAGLVLAFMVGPAFLLIIKNSIEKGFKAGASFALGVMLSDALILFSTYWGLSYIFENTTFQLIFGIAGGILIVGLGLYLLWGKSEDFEMGDQQISPVGKSWKLTLKGFLINTLSPVAFAFWITFISASQLDFGYTQVQNITFFAFVLITLLSCDFLKAYMAHHISRFLDTKRIRIMNRVFGFILAGIGLRLLFVYVIL